MTKTAGLLRNDAALYYSCMRDSAGITENSGVAHRPQTLVQVAEQLLQYLVQRETRSET